MEEEGDIEKGGGKETKKGIQQRQTKAGNERGSASLLENAQPGIPFDLFLSPFFRSSSHSLPSYVY